MLRSFFLLSLFVFFYQTGLAARLEYFGEVEIPHNQKFQKTSIGGLSGMTWTGNSLYAVSDDKGGKSPERFYEFSLSINKKKIELSPKAVHFFKNLPRFEGRPPFLDLEGMAWLGDSFLFSSEGSNNTKPRTPPRIFRTTKDGEWKEDFKVPEKYISQPSGRQTKGVQNNAAFEGLSASPNGDVVFVAIESSLQQDFVTEGEEWVRLLKFEKKDKGVFYPVAEYAYRLDALKDQDGQREIFRGVSEILYVDSGKLLVLERGLQISKTLRPQYSSALYEVDLLKATNILEIEKLGPKIQFVGVKKHLILDFFKDLSKPRANKAIQNFEALSWGPDFSDGVRSLLVLSDNNFSKREKTELLVFKFWKD